MINLTNLATIRALSEKYGFSFSKGYGQNFLVNPGICPKICDAAEVTQEMNVLEIGPGFGTLTQQLALRAKKVVAVEVDARLLPVLNETLAGLGNVKVVNQDVLRCNLAALIQEEFEGPVAVCANLPYYITSPILMKLLEEKLPLESIVVMVQKEAAARIAAAPGSREGGAISYAAAYYAAPRLCFTVKPGSFYPPPKVTSAVIKLVPHKTLPLQGKAQQNLFRLIKAAFGQRRKTLANAASAGLALPKEAVARAMQQVGLPPLYRPEQLTLAQYMQLAGALWPQGEADG